MRSTSTTSAMRLKKQWTKRQTKAKFATVRSGYDPQNFLARALSADLITALDMPEARCITADG
jgi:hypothetical protein